MDPPGQWGVPQEVPCTGLAHGQVAVAIRPWHAAGCYIHGERFVLNNWPQGRGNPGEGPCGAPEASREGNFVGGSYLPEEEGWHCAHSLTPGTRPWPLGWA